MAMADAKGGNGSGQGTLGRIASQFSLSRLYSWWVGPDTESPAAGGRVRSISLSNSLTIKLPTAPVLPGQQLSGTLQAELSSPKTSDLILEVKGVEHVQIKAEPSLLRCCKRRQGESEPEGKTSVVLDVACVAHSGSPLSAAVHQIPFIFNVPPGLSGSFYDETSQYVAVISYTVTAKFGDDSLESVHRFDVAQPPRAKPAMGEALRRLNATERVRLQVELEGNSYCPGGVVYLRVGVNSTTVRAITKLHVTLAKTLALSSGDRQRSFRETLVQREYSGFEPCYLGERVLAFPLPKSVGTFSARGDLVQCQYELRVACMTGRGELVATSVPFDLVPLANADTGARTEMAAAGRRRRPVWEDDANAPACTQCARKFRTPFPRRHHCRHCGRVFCVWCCKRYTNIDNLEYRSPARVCDACFPLAVAGGVPYASDDADGGDSASLLALSKSPRRS